MNNDNPEYSWFDKNNYSETEYLDLEGWLYELIVRRFIYFDNTETFVKQSSEYMEQINIVDKSLVHEVDNHLVFKTLVKKEIPYNYTKLDVLENKSIAETQSDDWQIYRFDWLNTYSDIRVDLSQSNTLIKKDFNTWLTNKRKIAKKTKKNHRKRSQRFSKVTDGDMERWRKSGLLEYTDLAYYAFIKNLDLTANEAGDLIFPDHKHECETGNKINDTTKPTFESISYLINQISWHLHITFMDNIKSDLLFRKKTGF